MSLILPKLSAAKGFKPNIFTGQPAVVRKPWIHLVAGLYSCLLS